MAEYVGSESTNAVGLPSIIVDHLIAARCVSFNPVRARPAQGAQDYDSEDETEFVVLRESAPGDHSLHHGHGAAPRAGRSRYVLR